jgi:hypothetical protein
MRLSWKSAALVAAAVIATAALAVARTGDDPSQRAPKREPTPSAAACTRIAAAGSDLSDFLATLRPGDTGCLRGSTYTDGPVVVWTTPGTSADARVSLQSVPGERAALVGTELLLDSDYQVVRGLTVRDVTASDGDGISVSGSGSVVVGNLIRNVARQGILLHTDAVGATITRNFVTGVGQEGSNLHHGIYIQGRGHLVAANVFADIRGGYGIHVYPDTSDVDVLHNTVVGSRTRSGIIVDTTGSSIRVANNVFADNDRYGIHFVTCGDDCLIDRNLAWDNGDGSSNEPGATGRIVEDDPRFADVEYRLGEGSAALDAARSDLVVSPDHDGNRRPRGSADLGAYER